MTTTIYHVLLDREQMISLASILEMQLREVSRACAQASVACDSRAVRTFAALVEQAQEILDEVHLAIARGTIEAAAQEQLAEYRAITTGNTGKGN